LRQYYTRAKCRARTANNNGTADETPMNAYKIKSEKPIDKIYKIFV